MLDVFPGLAVDSQRLEKLDRDKQVKDSRDSHRPKEPNEDGLLNVIHLRGKPVKGKNEGETSQEQHEDAEPDKSMDGDHIIV